MPRACFARAERSILPRAKGRWIAAKRGETEGACYRSRFHSEIGVLPSGAVGTFQLSASPFSS